MSRRQTERCLPRAREFGLSWLEDQREKILYGLAMSGGRQLEEACSRVLEELVHVNAPADFMHVGMDDPLTVAERLHLIHASFAALRLRGRPGRREEVVH